MNRFVRIMALTIWMGSLPSLLDRSVVAQELPPIFKDTPIQRVAVTSIAQFPVNTFLENIAVLPNGSLLVTSHEEGKLYSIQPGKSPALFATLPGKGAGLALTRQGSVLVTGSDLQQTPTVFSITPEGQVKTLLSLPDAVFLNGITHLGGDRYLMADSYRGAIWELDASQATATIWLEHPLLARASAQNPIPAVNGLKRFKDTLYVSNTAKQLLLKIPLLPTLQPGDPQVWKENVNIDDFAFDQSGTMYGATHIYNSVIAISPSGTVTTLAQAEDGLSGSTALVFGKGKDDRTSLYTVTNGGMFLPPPTGVEPGRVLRLNVGQPGFEAP